MSCQAQHTNYQLGMENWRCPDCDRHLGRFFYLSEPAEGKGCDLLHSDDRFVCRQCNKAWWGNQLSLLWQLKRRSRKEEHVSGTLSSV